MEFIKFVNKIYEDDNFLNEFLYFLRKESLNTVWMDMLTKYFKESPPKEPKDLTFKGYDQNAWDFMEFEKQVVKTICNEKSMRLDFEGMEGLCQEEKEFITLKTSLKFILPEFNFHLMYLVQAINGTDKPYSINDLFLVTCETLHAAAHSLILIDKIQNHKYFVYSKELLNEQYLLTENNIERLLKFLNRLIIKDESNKIAYTEQLACGNLIKNANETQSLQMHLPEDS